MPEGARKGAGPVAWCGGSGQIPPVESPKFLRDEDEYGTGDPGGGQAMPSARMVTADDAVRPGFEAGGGQELPWAQRRAAGRDDAGEDQSPHASRAPTDGGIRHAGLVRLAAGHQTGLLTCEFTEHLVVRHPTSLATRGPSKPSSAPGAVDNRHHGHGVDVDARVGASVSAALVQRMVHRRCTDRCTDGGRRSTVGTAVERETCSNDHLGRRHGSPARVRAPHHRGARHPLRPAVVHRRARDP